jgi:hypothetical protein
MMFGSARRIRASHADLTDNTVNRDLCVTRGLFSPRHSLVQKTTLKRSKRYLL